VINTWEMTGATDIAYSLLSSPNPPSPATLHLDSLEMGVHYCEIDDHCGWTVGVGGSPDEHGETILDASIIDGDTFTAGSVAGLRRIPNAIGVARAITKYTKHTMLVGDLASQFAIAMGFPERDLHSNLSISEWIKWKENRCQPNYRKNVIPDPTTSCGPYRPVSARSEEAKRPLLDEQHHDTIGMVVLSGSGSIAAGASTNGANWKVPGRVGDVPIIGSAAYADSRIGGCASTGDGDLLMRFLPCHLVVENLRNGFPLQVAADRALLRIAEAFPIFQGALVVLSSTGEFTGSSYGWISTMSVRNSTMDKTIVYQIHPISLGANGYYHPSYLSSKQ